MATYKGKAVVISKPASELYDRISDHNALQQRIDTLPEEARQKLGQIKFADDRIIIEAPAVGQIALAVAERIPSRLLRLSAENSPIPLGITLNLNEKAPSETEVQADIDVEIPMMLRPLVGGKLQEAADKFGEMFSNFFSN